MNHSLVPNDPDCKNILNGCSLNSNQHEQLINLVLVIVYMVFGAVILAINLIILVFYLKKKDSIWTFTNYCFILLLVYNILAALSTFLVSLSACYSFDTNKFFCLFKYCFLYFIGLMMIKFNILIAVERLICLKWTNKYRKIVRFKYSLVFNLIITSICFCYSYSPIIFEWNNYGVQCDCGLNSVIPYYYIIINNVIFFALSIGTSFVYLYIYYFVKQSHKKVQNHLIVVSEKTKKSSNKDTLFIVGENFMSTSEHSIISLRTTYVNFNKKSNILSRIQSIKSNLFKSPKTFVNKKPDKLQILRTQTLIFIIFFISWFPYIFLTSYEIFNQISTYEGVSKARNFSISAIMISCMINPIVYTYRLKFMKNLFN